ncbi:MAG: helix-turn-helix transcriptional regulator [Clostridia bacterium]|nr:helix-turn-helix transcriptional regulator [Clostridia bacterium]MBQ8600649.1 helix-turn-helix transcriptional regulator [Clostridia bacterium]
MVYYTDRLQKARKDRNLTQRELARLLEMRHQQYNRYETGKTAMTVEVFRKICVILNVSSDYLLGFTDESKPLK